MAAEQSLWWIQAQADLKTRRGASDKSCKGGAGMDPKAPALLKSFVGRVKQRFPKSRVYLFGSRARQDFHTDSDHDLLIISPEFQKIPFIKRLVEIYLLQEEPLPIEVVCLSPKEYEERSSGLTMLHEVKSQALEFEA